MSSNNLRGIDLTGIAGPFALLKISQIFREMETGEILEIVGCDPDTRSDLFRVLPAPSWRLLEGAGEPGRFRIQKRNVPLPDKTAPRQTRAQWRDASEPKR
ncbi:MAG: sulfurtransferase TusA family protein [Desulfococcaceae bacterium]